MDDYYNARAAEYEQIYFRDNPPRRKEIDDEIIKLKKMVTGKNILECACGTGYWTSRMSTVANSIVAFDMSEEMLREAKEKKYDCPTDFIQADLNKLPFQNHSFDVICLGFWFSHHPIEAYDNLFEALKKQLQPGGKIWMIDNNPPAEGPLNHSTGSDKFGNNYKKRFLDNGQEFIILKNYFTKEQLTEIFQKHFSVNSVTYGKYYWSTELTFQP